MAPGPISAIVVMGTAPSKKGGHWGRPSYIRFRAGYARPRCRSTLERPPPRTACFCDLPQRCLLAGFAAEDLLLTIGLPVSMSRRTPRTGAAPSAGRARGALSGRPRAASVGRLGGVSDGWWCGCGWLLPPTSLANSANGRRLAGERRSVCSLRGFRAERGPGRPPLGFL